MNLVNFVGMLAWSSLFLLCWLLMFGPPPNENGAVIWSLIFFGLIALSATSSKTGKSS